MLESLDCKFPFSEAKVRREKEGIHFANCIQNNEIQLATNCVDSISNLSIKLFNRFYG